MGAEHEGIPVKGTENSNTQTAPAAGDGANGAAPAATGQANTAAAAVAPAKTAAAKAPPKAAKKKADATGDAETDPAAKASPNPQSVEIWPLRSYQDAGEIKRRGGKSYNVPKRHADALIARGLATDEQPAKAETNSTE